MHLAPGSGDDFEDWEIERIHGEASDFARRTRLRWSDADDLENEGRAAWWRQRRSWDSSKSAAPTYLRRVVRNTFRDIAKAERTASRAGDFMARSIEAPLGYEDMALADSLAGPNECTEIIWMEFERILGTLTQRQMRLLLGRLAGYEMTELAKDLGVNRDTLYDDLKRIKVAFRDAGLGESQLRSDT